MEQSNSNTVDVGKILELIISEISIWCILPHATGLMTYKVVWKWNYEKKERYTYGESISKVFIQILKEYIKAKEEEIEKAEKLKLSITNNYHTSLRQNAARQEEYEEQLKHAKELIQ